MIIKQKNYEKMISMLVWFPGNVKSDDKDISESEEKLSFLHATSNILLTVISQVHLIKKRPFNAYMGMCVFKYIEIATVVGTFCKPHQTSVSFE